MPKKKRAVEWPKPKGRVKVLEPNDSRFPETLASLVDVDERCYEPKHRNLAALAQSAALRRSTGLVAAWDQEGTLRRVPHVYARVHGSRGVRKSRLIRT